MGCHPEEGWHQFAPHELHAISKGIRTLQDLREALFTLVPPQRGIAILGVWGQRSKTQWPQTFARAARASRAAHPDRFRSTLGPEFKNPRK